MMRKFADDNILNIHKVKFLQTFDPIPVTSRHVQWEDGGDTDSDLGSDSLSIAYSSFNSDINEDLTPNQIRRVLTPDTRVSVKLHIHSRLQQNSIYWFCLIDFY